MTSKKNVALSAIPSAVAESLANSTTALNESAELVLMLAKAVDQNAKGAKATAVKVTQIIAGHRGGTELAQFKKYWTAQFPGARWVPADPGSKKRDKWAYADKYKFGNVTTAWAEYTPEKKAKRDPKAPTTAQVWAGIKASIARWDKRENMTAEDKEAVQAFQRKVGELVANKG